MGAAHTVCHTTATAPRQPMAALARGLGAACRISVARLRPAESDVRSMSSTRSKTVGAVRQVRGGAEAGFWVVCWVARGSARQLAAAGSGSGAAERGRGALCRASPWAGGVQRLFWPAHSPGAATDRPHGGACTRSKSSLYIFSLKKTHSKLRNFLRNFHRNGHRQSG